MIPESMSAEVRAEYEAAMAEVVLARGQVVAEDPSEYGWADWKLGGHLAACEVLHSGEVTETSWSEFVGTFAPGGPNETRHGAEVDRVTCKCGQLKRRTIRYKADLSEMVGAVIQTMHDRRA